MSLFHRVSQENCHDKHRHMADDDEYVEAFVGGDDDALLAAVKQREAACQPLLKPMGGNPSQALQLSLGDPPYSTSNEAIKVRLRRERHPSPAARPPFSPARSPRAQNASFGVVASCLGAFKEEVDMEAAVGALSLEECDVLMKYLYRGLGQPNDKVLSYNSLLKWHPLVLAKAGQGSIVRAISEKNQAL